MFVYHYVIIPFHTQYLPRHAPQGAGIQGAGIGDPKPLSFLYWGAVSVPPILGRVDKFLTPVQQPP